MTGGRGLLVAFLTAITVVAAVLVMLTVQARAVRGRRERAIAVVQGRHRHLVLEVASGEDDERVAWAELAALPPRDWRGVRPEVVAMLAKVRGRPAGELAALLASYGELERARAELAAGRAGRRARAAYLLGLARDGGCVPRLCALLGDGSADVRLVAARSLGMIGDATATTALLAASGGLPGMRQGQTGLPAWVAAEALLRIGVGGQDAVAHALSATDANVRAVAARVSLYGLFPAALAPARVCVLFEAETGTKETLLALLGALGDESDVPVLAAYTHPLAPARLRRAAVRALGTIGTPGAAQRLTPLLADDDRSVATAAGDALAALGRHGVDLLGTAMSGGGAARRVAAAALHMARLRGEAVAP